MSTAFDDIDQLTINTLRGLCIDAVQQADSGHPGAPMGLAPAAYVLFKRVMRHHPKNPDWIDRDRFVLSGGHASSLLYSLLYLFGYGLTLDDMKAFRQWNSRTPGHPEYGQTPGVETTTGPLGQGIANAVGMAIAETHLAARFNKADVKLINHHTYCMCGDGDLMEGVAMEAVSLAGHLGLGKLILIYDDNGISIEGSTELTFTENVAEKFKAMAWHVVAVEDGNDLEAIHQAIQSAKDALFQPSLINVRTHIAYGSPNKQDTADAHGAPLGEAEVRAVKAFYGMPAEQSFYVPEPVLDAARSVTVEGDAQETAWQERFADYKRAWPAEAGLFADAVSGFLTKGWDAGIPRFSVGDAPMATRAVSGKVLNAIAPNLPVLMGGSADLAPSNKTYIDEAPEYQKHARDGRNIRFGVREHAMGAILSGMYLHGGIRPYGGTFLVFADYMRPAIRLAALMKLPVIYVFTHDSVAVGEDGPTHQPVEQLASLRAIPGLNVVRPADAAETALAWKKALETTNAPTALILSRQKLPHLDPSGRTGECHYGAYSLRNHGDRADMILIATGSEVHISLSAADILAADHQITASVVSMPSWEWFEAAPPSYQDQILPPTVRCRLAVEAGIAMGWEKFVGPEGGVISMDRFGASAPGGTVLEKFGFTADHIVKKALALLG